MRDDDVFSWTGRRGALPAALLGLWVIVLAGPTGLAAHCVAALSGVASPAGDGARDGGQPARVFARAVHAVDPGSPARGTPPPRSPRAELGTRLPLPRPLTAHVAGQRDGVSLPLLR